MFKVEISRSGLSTIGKRGFQEIGKAAIEKAAEYWHATYLKLHFDNIAYRRYGYTSRAKETDRAKVNRYKSSDGERAIGEVKPLVFTGRSRERALGKKIIRSTAPNYQTYRAEVVIDAPAFNFGKGVTITKTMDGTKVRSRKEIDMRDEVKRVTPQEEKTLEKVFAQEWEKQLIAHGLRSPKRRRRIG